MSTNRPLQAVIFDRDGVLTFFDTNALSAYLRPILPIPLPELMLRWEQWGDATGAPTSMEEEERFIRGFWSNIISSFSLTSSQANKLYDINYPDFMKVYPDVLPTMQMIRNNGLQIGVLSNFSLASLASSLDEVGLGDYVDVACAATVIGASKPAPESYLTAASQLQVTPESCLFLDDEEDCVEGAINVGMTAYLVCRSASMDTEDKGANIIHGLTDLADLLHRSTSEKD